LRPAAAFFAFVPPRDDGEREPVEAERDLEVPDVERERDVPVDERDLLVPDVERERLVPVLERDLLAAEVERDLLVPDLFVPDLFVPDLLVPDLLVRDLLVPDVERARLAPVVERDLLVAELERDLPAPEPARDREVPDVERDDVELADVDRDFAAVARPPLAPAAFFFAVLPPLLELERDDPLVERLRLVVERDELRDVPELRVVPDFFAREPELPLEVDRDRDPLDDDRRGDAARAREIASSRGSSATDSTPNRSGMRPALPTGSDWSPPKPSGVSSLASSSK
jgi:hypothetical protein